VNQSNRMNQRVKQYLALRRAFGFRLSIAGEQLQNFARFANRTARDKPLTLELALRWAQSSSTGKQTTAARRLLILRPFARYLRTIDPLTEILPKGILGPAQYRPVPHIYTAKEIRAVLDAASKLSPRSGLRSHSFGTYFRLLACTGMRPPEPLHLTRADINLESHSLVVRETKFSKSRIVVLHPTASKALQKKSPCQTGPLKNGRSYIVKGYFPRRPRGLPMPVH
jgi:integrase